MAWVLWAEPTRARALWAPALVGLGWAPLGLAVALVVVGRWGSRAARRGPAVRLENLALAGAAAGALTLPWFFWAALAVREKLVMDAAWSRSVETNLSFVGSFLHDALPWAPLLLPVGALWALVQARRRPEGLATLLALLGSAAILVASGHPKTRYLLGLVVYAAALGGVWVGAGTAGAGTAGVGPGAGGKAWDRLGSLATALISLGALASLGAWLVLPGDAPIYRTAQVAAPVGVQAPGPATDGARTGAAALDLLRLPVGRPPVTEVLDLSGLVGTLGAFQPAEVWGLVHHQALPAHLEDGELVEHLEAAALRAGVLFVPFMAPPLGQAPAGPSDELSSAFAFFLARTRAAPGTVVGLFLLRPEAAATSEGEGEGEGTPPPLPEGLAVVGWQVLPVGEGRAIDLWILQATAPLGQLAPGERAPFARQPMGRAPAGGQAPAGAP